MKDNLKYMYFVLSVSYKAAQNIVLFLNTPLGFFSYYFSYTWVTTGQEKITIQH